MDKDGGGAFPARGCFDDAGELIAEQRGMSLRDYFAAHAPPMDEAWWDDEYVADQLCAIATWNYAYADAMLEARKP